MLVDTAGLRRKRKQRQGIEYYSELRALEAAERADVALVLVDATEGIVEQDLAVADVARKADCSTLVVLSKWDIDARSRIEDVRAAARAAACASGRRSSPSRAKTGRGARAAARPRRGALREAHRAASRRRELNRFLGELREARPPPSRNGQTAEPPLRDAGRRRGRRASASSSTTRRSSRATTATGSRTSCASASSSQGVPVSIDFVTPIVRAVVVGGGSWGTAFAALLADAATR